MQKRTLVEAYLLCEKGKVKPKLGEIWLHTEKVNKEMDS